MRSLRKLISAILFVAFLVSGVFGPQYVGYAKGNDKKDTVDRGDKNARVKLGKTTRFIVKYKDDKGREDVKSTLKGNLVSSKKLKSKKNKNVDVIATDKITTVEEFRKELRNKKLDANIEYIVTDDEVKLESNDTYFNQQWGIYSAPTVPQSVYSSAYGTSADGFRSDINVVDAWNITQGAGAVVGVIDTGVDISHEDLSANIWTNPGEIPGNGIDDDGNGYIDDIAGWDFCEDDNSVHNAAMAYDEQHGTHVAGIIAAVKDNGKGITGVAPQAKVMPLKAFKNGTAYTSDIIEAIEYAEAMGIKVLNCSWGTSVDNLALKEVIENSNILFVCAAGNNGVNIDVNPVYPAAYTSDNIISVASVNKDGVLSSFSNYGVNSVDVAAPGEGIFSTVPNNGYGEMSGTSMAAPFVTGEAALIGEKKAGQNFNIENVRETVIKSSNSLLSITDSVYAGSRINCSTAVGALNSLYSNVPLEIIHTGYGISGGWTTQEGYPRYVVDMNKDGYADIVGFASNGIIVSLNIKGSSFDAGAYWTSAFGNDSSWTTRNEYPRYVIDVNKDGYPDIVGFGVGGVLVSLNQSGTSFSAPVYWTSAFGKNSGWNTQNEYPRYVVDMNKDGYPDIVGFGGGGTLVSLNQGGVSFAAPLYWSNGYGGNQGWITQNEYPRYLADVNKDGYPDVIGFADNGVIVSLNQEGSSFDTGAYWSTGYGINQGWITQDNYPRYVVDVNKDGYADIVGFAGNGVIVSLNQGGSSFNTGAYWTSAFGIDSGWTTQNDYPRDVVDVNADGYPDIIGFANSGVILSLNQSGNLFDSCRPWTTGFGKDSGWTTQDDYPRYIVDVNKDGYADVIGFGISGVYTSLCPNEIKSGLPLITLNQTTTGTIDSSTTKNLYRVNIPQTGVLTADLNITSGSSYYTVNVYDSSNSLIRSINNWSQTNRKFMVDAQTPGDYYIEVVNTYGQSLSYTLQVNRKEKLELTQIGSNSNYADLALKVNNPRNIKNGAVVLEYDPTYYSNVTSQSSIPLFSLTGLKTIAKKLIPGTGGTASKVVFYYDMEDDFAEDMEDKEVIIDYISLKKLIAYGSSAVTISPESYLGMYDSSKFSLNGGTSIVVSSTSAQSVTDSVYVQMQTQPQENAQITVFSKPSKEEMSKKASEILENYRKEHPSVTVTQATYTDRPNGGTFAVASMGDVTTYSSLYDPNSYSSITGFVRIPMGSGMNPQKIMVTLTDTATKNTSAPVSRYVFADKVGKFRFDNVPANVRYTIGVKYTDTITRTGTEKPIFNSVDKDIGSVDGEKTIFIQDIGFFYQFDFNGNGIMNESNEADGFFNEIAKTSGVTKGNYNDLLLNSVSSTTALSTNNSLNLDKDSEVNVSDASSSVSGGTWLDDPSDPDEADTNTYSAYPTSKYFWPDEFDNSSYPELPLRVYPGDSGDFYVAFEDWTNGNGITEDYYRSQYNEYLPNENKYYRLIIKDPSDEFVIDSIGMPQSRSITGSSGQDLYTFVIFKVSYHISSTASNSLLYVKLSLANNTTMKEGFGHPYWDSVINMNPYKGTVNLDTLGFGEAYLDDILSESGATRQGNTISKVVNGVTKTYNISGCRTINGEVVVDIYDFASALNDDSLIRQRIIALNPGGGTGTGGIGICSVEGLVSTMSESEGVITATPPMGSSQNIKRIQMVLKRAGYWMRPPNQNNPNGSSAEDVEPTGNFGEITIYSLERFQREVMRYTDAELYYYEGGQWKYIGCNADTAARLSALYNEYFGNTDRSGDFDSQIADVDTKDQIDACKIIYNQANDNYISGNISLKQKDRIQFEAHKEAQIARADYIVVNPQSTYAYNVLGGVQGSGNPLNRTLMNVEGNQQWGIDVLVIQRVLELYGFFELPVGQSYGTYGPETAGAVESYQAQYVPGTPDGKVGSNTFASLFSTSNASQRTPAWLVQLNEWRLQHDIVKCAVAFEVVIANVEVPIKGGGRKAGATGFADILKKSTGQVWEVKPDNGNYTSGQGVQQLQRYINASYGYAQASDIRTPLIAGYTIPSFSIPYKNNQVINVRGGVRSTASDSPSETGMVYYRTTIQQEQYQEVVVPAAQPAFAVDRKVQVDWGTVTAVVTGVAIIGGIVVCIALIPETGGASTVAIIPLASRMAPMLAH